MKTINVAEDFSRYPGGRYRTDGDNSAERFREDLLAPALRSGEKVTVNLDGPLGFGSAWLEEAFGGLVRVSQIAPRTIEKNLSLEGCPEYHEQIFFYINDATIVATTALLRKMHPESVRTLYELACKFQRSDASFAIANPDEEKR